MRAVVFILLRNAHRLRAHLICSVASAKCGPRWPRRASDGGGDPKAKGSLRVLVRISLLLTICFRAALLQKAACQ